MFGLEYEEEQKLHEKTSWYMVYASIPTYLLLATAIPSPWGKTLEVPKAAPNSGHQNVPNPSSLSTTMSWWLGGVLVPAPISWFLFEIPNLIWVVICYYDRSLKNTSVHQDPLPGTNKILLALFAAHYVRRAIIYPLSMSKRSKKMPLMIILAAMTFTTINGYLQAQSLCRFGPMFSASWLVRNPQGVFGLILYATGMFINWQSDSILRDLRNRGSGYTIPTGGCFNFVTAPHYLGEIVEWIGFCLACECTVASVAFAVYTAANLVPRATAHHRWYKATFGEKYPKKRRAVVPFLW